MTGTSGKHRQCVDLSTNREQLLQHGTDLVVIGTFSLSAIGNPECKYLRSSPFSEEVKDYLGIPYTSDSSTAKLWVQPQEDGIDLDDNAEVHMAARCVESILGVTSVPKVHLKSDEPSEQPGEIQASPLEPTSIVIPESEDTTRPSSVANVGPLETSDNPRPPLHALTSSSSLVELLNLTDLFTDLGEEEDRILKSLYPDRSREELGFEGIALVANIIGSQFVRWNSML